MKPKAADLLDSLATGEDKVAKVNRVKAELRNNGFKVRTVMRKLAHGRKVYFHVSMKTPTTILRRPARITAEAIIVKEFSVTRITSCGLSEITFVEY